MTEEQKIREEVERMHNLLPIMDGDNISVNYADRICTTLEMYIDSLQEEPVSEELEEAAIKYAQDKYMPVQTSQAFKAGAQWQKEKEYTCYEEAFEDGAAWKHNQIMEKAIDVEVKVDAGDYPYIPQMELYNYDKDIPLAKEGDKYKVILIKED